MSLDSTLVHYGVQVQQKTAPPPRRGPVIVYPNPEQRDPNTERRDDSNQRPPLVR